MVCRNHEPLDAIVESIPPAAGSTISLSTEYRQHADFVWRCLQRLGVKPSELCDALQEVFLVAHRKLGEFDGERAQFSTWLFGIAVRTAHTFRRRGVRHEQTQCLDDWVLADAKTPQSDCEGREAIEALHAVLNELSPELRATFVLFELEGESCAAIAELFDVPVGTVYSRLHKARKCVLARFDEPLVACEGDSP